MSRWSADWERKLGDRVKSQNRKEARANAAAHLAAAKRTHDQLEKACEELAWVKYGVRLYKADASTRGKQRGNVTAGIPDRIAAIAPTGRFAGFEIKAGRDQKLKRSQPKVHADLIADGAAAYVVGSLEDFDNLLGLLVQGEREKFRIIQNQRGGE